MDKLSVGGAMSAGFRLVSREPLVFVGWILVELIASTLPSIALEATGAASPTAAAPFFLLVAWLMTSLLGGGVLRASLEPDARRGLYLRLGPQEGWLALSLLAMAAILLVGGIVTSVLLALPLGVLVNAGSGAGVVVGVALVYAVTLCVGVWLFTRFGLALPIAFATRRLAFGEAWRVSKGQAGRIFGVLAALTALLVVAYVVIIGTALSMVGAAIPLDQLSGALQRDPQAMAKALNPTTISAMAMMLLLVSAISRVAFFGAWADLYCQLRPAPPPAEVFG